ncbi:hypothetical protein ARHIZOSPH14_21810 [Agromyces rhizosphaerae]|uniref:Uncharacterized protein n=1 Tax=Agromyces rhizosphaerae TaxID=88374 RepID=A0A9W6CZ50_9MICO|nr:UbiA family prenyltransferase [Agromyces rhizosphaerae]GLI27939.1 hypothetical protein ARHIZOSPH14_21810 [Agromyces rhizosphaerae]
MDPTRLGRMIEWIEGHPGDITRRGDEIVDLGMQMRESAGLLEAIAEGAEGMEGLSVDALREVIGEVHEELRLAGERYSPTGLALKTYAGSLEEVQTGLRMLLDDCEQAWNAYTARRLEYMSTPQPTPDPETGVVDATAHDDALLRREQAHDAWEMLADDYDARYDTWEAAFERATDAIGSANDGGIEDSWRDDLAGFSDAALGFLQFAGIVLAVLAIIIGGPLIAVLGTIVGILTLVLTLYMKYYGRRSWGDVAWAVVGVIPIGKLGAFAEGAETGTRAFLRGFVAADEIGPAISQARNGWTAIRTGFTAAGSGVPGLAGAGRSLFTEIADEMGSGADIFARYMGAADRAALEAATDNGVNAAHFLAGSMDVRIKTILANLKEMPGIDAPPAPPVDTWREQLAASS